jgi:uncharacterized protein (TIGR03437 family)
MQNMKPASLFVFMVLVVIPMAAQATKTDATIAAVTNAASFGNCQMGSPTTLYVSNQDGSITTVTQSYSCIISPGELVSIFGNWLSPLPNGGYATAGMNIWDGGLVGTVNQNVAVAFTDTTCDFSGSNTVCTLGGSTWLAPIAFLSPTQINCLVPYETGINEVTYVAIQIHSVALGVSPPFIASTTDNVCLNCYIPGSTPGIFTDDGTGTGQGAILNQDGSVNGTKKPAKPGDIISVFMTGAGWMSNSAGGWGLAPEASNTIEEQAVTNPSAAMIDGSITCMFTACPTLSAIPTPTLAVNAWLDNKPATVVWAGSAPGLVEGVLQVNLQVPANTVSGNPALFVSVGPTDSETSFYSQTVTVAVQ